LKNLQAFNHLRIISKVAVDKSSTWRIIPRASHLLRRNPHHGFGVNQA